MVRTSCCHVLLYRYYRGFSKIVVDFVFNIKDQRNILLEESKIQIEKLGDNSNVSRLFNKKSEVPCLNTNYLNIEQEKIENTLNIQ